ncbi:MAG: glutathione S-transferase family protein [Symplocastrum torsivum CPER-KK1]|uniref:Glutathione S-transferase family protein n=1 Tax=Symplocastrum torsivum CPER-KK1 TaxID=450513 RepID=A0A951PGQ2_9CYAN|nr:glutathione S-transferase family protein [Symplocastrum torsivum CPER-KK1]
MTQLTLVIGNKNYSSWSWRPWLAMKQAGLDFAEIRIPLDTPTSHQEIRRYSPSGRVPVLLHNDLTIWESLAICEYVAEGFAPNLWPKDTAARAVARSVSTEMHAGFVSLRQNMPMDCRSRHPGLGMNASVQADVDRITAIWRECREKFGDGGDLLFGHFTIADAMFAPVVSRFVTYEVHLDSVAQAYAEAVWALPAMQEWVLAANNEVESIETIQH